MKRIFGIIAISAAFALSASADTMVINHMAKEPLLASANHAKKKVCAKPTKKVVEQASHDDDHGASQEKAVVLTEKPTVVQEHPVAHTSTPAEHHAVPQQEQHVAVAPSAHGATCGGTFTIKQANVVNAVAKKMIDEIIADNSYYQRTKGKGFFEAIKNGQTPRATVVSCSDSRVQMAALDATPENDLFVIRNIGNQISSNEGSVAYGVHHLHTPLLIVVGHSRCGAIKAAMSDYSSENSAIRKEVDSLSLSINKAFPAGHSHGGNEDWLKGVTSNVNQQIQYALSVYKHEVESGALTIVGGIFDLADDMKGGEGKFAIININGETNPENLAKLNATIAPHAGH